MKRKVLFLFLFLFLFSVSEIFAIYCVGYVKAYYINAMSGDVYMEHSGLDVNCTSSLCNEDVAKVCNVNNAISNISVEECKAYLPMLAISFTTKTNLWVGLMAGTCGVGDNISSSIYILKLKN